MPPKNQTSPFEKIQFGGDLMIFEELDFPSPTEEEIKLVKKIAKFNPEDLDGRETWILQEFIEGDCDE